MILNIASSFFFQFLTERTTIKAGKFLGLYDRIVSTSPSSGIGFSCIHTSHRPPARVKEEKLKFRILFACPLVEYCCLSVDILPRELERFEDTDTAIRFEGSTNMQILCKCIFSQSHNDPLRQYIYFSRALPMPDISSLCCFVSR